MRWPWSKPTEQRSQTGYFPTIAEWAQATSNWNASDIRNRVAPLEVASRIWGDACLATRVSGHRLVDGRLLATIMRRLIHSGQCLLMYRYVGGGLQIASAWTVIGESADPTTWEYQVELPAPTGHESVRASADRVALILWESSRQSPWKGIGPGAGATLPAMVVAELDLLAEDLSSSLRAVGQLKTEATLGRDAIMDIIRGVARTRGQGRHGREDPEFADLVGLDRGFEVISGSQIGYEPAAQHVALRTAMARDVLAACSIPPELIFSGGGTADREAYRRFGVALRARVNDILGQLSDLLGTPLEADYRDLRSADIAGSARAAGTLTKAGFSASSVAETVGLDSLRESLSGWAMGDLENADP